MNKTELIAALKSDDFDKDALLDSLVTEAERTAPFRERPDIREHIDAFNTHRKEMFQPAVYKRDGEALATALSVLVADLQRVAAEAGVEIVSPEEIVASLDKGEAEAEAKASESKPKAKTGTAA